MNASQIYSSWLLGMSILALSIAIVLYVNFKSRNRKSGKRKKK